MQKNNCKKSKHVFKRRNPMDIHIQTENLQLINHIYLGEFYHPITLTIITPFPCLINSLLTLPQSRVNQQVEIDPVQSGRQL